MPGPGKMPTNDIHILHEKVKKVNEIANYRRLNGHATFVNLYIAISMEHRPTAFCELKGS
jgi:hypothetical protein